MLYTVTLAETTGPRDLSDQLERGKVVFFPVCPIPLPGEAELRFLRSELGSHLSHKNPSYHADSDRIFGVRGSPRFQDRARDILRDHYGHVRLFLGRVLPDFARGWRVATSSFRPLQEKGRRIRAHASSELIHVDANAYGATNGDRILRFFVNVHPTESREWVSKGTFSVLFQRYAAEAGIAGFHDLRKGFWNEMYSGILRGVSAAGMRSARLVDSSPYDRLMRRFHNWMKDSREFQESPDGLLPLRFPPYSAWMVLTDMVSHACVYGQHAFIDTFLIPLSNCRMPEHSPYHILRSGKAPDPAGDGIGRDLARPLRSE